MYSKLVHDECNCLQNIIFNILLALGLLAGGISSAVNASDVQRDLIDSAEQYCDADDSSQQLEEYCSDIKRLRDTQAAAAVS